MWEIAKSMITWELCSKCGCSLSLEDIPWIPVNCDDCWRWNWIYTETQWKNVKTPREMLKMIIDYNYSVRFQKPPSKKAILNFVLDIVEEL